MPMTRVSRVTAALAVAGALMTCLAATAAPPRPNLAGCDAGRPATAHLARGDAGAVRPSRWRLVPCTVPVGVPGYETTLAFAGDGTVYYQGEDTATVAPKVAVSTDDGRSWADVSPTLAGAVSTHPVTLDPYLTVDPVTDRVFSTDYTGACSTTSFSDDRGTSWTTSQVACTQTDHQAIFTGPPPAGGTAPVSYPNVVYHCSMSGGGSLFATMSSCSKSLDGGLTYLPTGAPAYTDDPQHSQGNFGIPGVCGGSHGHGVVGPDGTVYLPRNWCGHPYLAVSKDEGLTWERFQVSTQDVAMAELAITEAETGVALGPRGELFYVWLGRDRLPHLSVSRDGGRHWSKPLVVAAPGVKEANLPDVAAWRDGRVALFYIGSTDSKGAPFNECYDLGGCVASGDPSSSAGYENVSWNGYLTTSFDPLAAHPTFWSASLNPPGDPIARGFCGPRPGRCNLGDFQDVQFAPDGSPWASLVDACVATCARPRNDAERTNNAGVGIMTRLEPVRR
jgi:hypothetical protein